MTKNARIVRFGLAAAFVSLCLFHAFGAEKNVSRTFPVKPGGKLSLDADYGSIDVKASGENEVRVEVRFRKDSWSDSKLERFMKDFQVTFSQSGNDVTVVAEEEGGSRHFWNSGSKHPDVKFVVSVPKVYNLNLKTAGGWIKVGDLEGNAVCETSGGSLDLGRIKGMVDGRTSGGAIQIAGCEGILDVETSGGSISVGSTRGDIRANTSGGSITIEETYGSVQAGTSGGSISACFKKNPLKECSLETSGGWITVKGPGDLHVDLDAETSGGRVSTDFPVTLTGEINPQRLVAKINGGGPRLYLRTSGGNIRIENTR
jgi:DUF4097 and DUF4098 domain-containing protein YvlB